MFVQVNGVSPGPLCTPISPPQATVGACLRPRPAAFAQVRGPFVLTGGVGGAACLVDSSDAIRRLLVDIMFIIGVKRGRVQPDERTRLMPSPDWSRKTSPSRKLHPAGQLGRMNLQCAMPAALRLGVPFAGAVRSQGRGASVRSVPH